MPILAFLSQANLTDHELGRKAIRPEEDEISALECAPGSFALDGVCEPGGQSAFPVDKIALTNGGLTCGRRVSALLQARIVDVHVLSLVHFR